MDAMKKVVLVGEILAEIMADSLGAGFLEPIALAGPYPSGAPEIYIDQVAKLGQACAIIPAVGADDFGRVNLDRLTADGVDVSAVDVDPDRPTGTAFVRYRPDGSRSLVFNIKHSACGRLSRPVKRYQAACGFSLD
jgi:sugar/nucleoside kinase (ribokinase family)